MPPALTLHQGDAKAEYVEHPTEIARKALMAAAEVEWKQDRPFAYQLERFARTSPRREPIRREED